MTFTARFSTGCPACEQAIDPGDEVKWADDHVIHAACVDPDQANQPAPAPCPSCFMVPATNGACGCDPS
jgi:hypothetical protein